MGKIQLERCEFWNSFSSSRHGLGIMTKVICIHIRESLNVGVSVYLIIPDPSDEIAMKRNQMKCGLRMLLG